MGPKMSIWMVLMIALTSLTMAIDSSKPDESSSLAEAAAQVLRLCYANRTSAVGVAGDTDGLVVRTLHLRTTLAVTLIGPEDGEPTKLKLPHRLQVFLIVASSESRVVEILSWIKVTAWWNHLASFLIIDESPETLNGCSNALRVLHAAWMMDVINAKFLCLHPTKDLLIYSLNSHAKVAPDPWNLENAKVVETTTLERPWGLFVRSYQRNQTICDELDFDKTKDLSGRRIHVTQVTTLKKPNCSTLIDIPINQLLFKALNATFDQTNCDGDDDDLGSVNRTRIDSWTEMKSGLSDIALNIRFQQMVVNYTTTYPHFYSGVSAMTQPSGYKTPLDKIRGVVDNSTLVGLQVVVVVTFLFFRFAPRRSRSSSAILNTVIVMCELPLFREPTKVAPRLYLGGLFMFALTVRAVYQGDLASLLTLPVPLPEVETMRDLEDLGYQVYGHKSYARLFRNSALKRPFVGLDVYNCTGQVLKDPTAACVRPTEILINAVEKYGLHLSRNHVARLFTVYVIRDNWPLEHRVNEIFSRMTETGVTTYLKMDQTRHRISRIEFLKKLRRMKKFRVVTLKQLDFAFVVLGVGLVGAGVAFLWEVRRDVRAEDVDDPEEW